MICHYRSVIVIISKKFIQLNQLYKNSYLMNKLKQEKPDLKILIIFLITPLKLEKNNTALTMTKVIEIRANKIGLKNLK